MKPPWEIFDPTPHKGSWGETVEMVLALITYAMILGGTFLVYVLVMTP